MANKATIIPTHIFLFIFFTSKCFEKRNLVKMIYFSHETEGLKKSEMPEFKLINVYTLIFKKTCLVLPCSILLIKFFFSKMSRTMLSLDLWRSVLSLKVC